MHFRSLPLLVLPALLPLPALAQDNATQAPANSQIVVEGRLADKSEPMSGWRVAEGEHVLVYSNGDKDQLVRTAHNLEKLHFLLSMLLNRVGQPEDTAKLKVFLFGDAADFHGLGLRNDRWQQGPFPDSFPTERYYDPRPDGAMLATTSTDQAITLRRGRDLLSIDSIVPVNAAQTPNDTRGGMNNTVLGSVQAGEQQVDGLAVPLSAEGRLYSGFAQHYLMTYFPAAYPRWYLDGFGEIFSTLAANNDGTIEYGRAPQGFRDIIEWYGRYPVRQLFDGSYLSEAKKGPRWTPFHAWALTHMLFFSDEWRDPLRRYLAAVARGAPPEEAAAALGDPAKLQAALDAYRGRKIPFERMTYPRERAAAPIVRQLSRREATVVRADLVSDSRLEMPPASPPGADAKTAQRMARERSDALAARDRWLEDIRRNAAEYPRDVDAQLLLAEAECRSDHVAACQAAGDKALVLAPKDVSALTWSGIARTRQAITGPAADRDAGLKAARALLVRANHADPEAPLPLLAYYRSFVDAGQPAPEAAINGLIKVTETAPAAPGPRLMLGEEFARHGAPEAAVQTLRPVANGPYDSPEKPKAQQLLAALGDR